MAGLTAEVNIQGYTAPLYFQPGADSATAFELRDNAGNADFSYNSTSAILNLGVALQWIVGYPSPTVSQVTLASDAAPQNITIAPQAPFATATGTNRNPGNLLANIAAPTNGGTTEGFLIVQRAGVSQLQFGYQASNWFSGSTAALASGLTNLDTAIESVGTGRLLLKSGTNAAIALNAGNLAFYNSSIQLGMTITPGLTPSIVFGSSVTTATIETTSTGILAIQTATGNLNINTTASARTTNLATGAAAQTAVVGSTNTSSSLTLQHGTGGATINRGVATSGTPTGFVVNGAAHTGLTAAETILAHFNFNQTVTFSSGIATLPKQRALAMQRPTYANSGAGLLTISDAATLELDDSPTTSGGNIAITNPWTLSVLAGISRFREIDIVEASPATLTSSVNDYTGANGYSYVRVSSDATWDITGFAGGRPGKILVVHNVGSFNVRLMNQNASSGAANRMIMGPGAALADQTMTPNQTCILIYSGPDSRWRQVSALL